LSETVLNHANRDEPWLVLGRHRFHSRLIVGIEQYTSAYVVGQVLLASGTEVFITTVDPDSQRSSLLLSDMTDVVPLDRFIWIGTTSFARSAASALKTATILSESYGIRIMKLDVRNERNQPDNAQTIQCARELRAAGFEVLPFIYPVVEDALTLEDLGCCALRLMAAPVASGLGILEPDKIRAVIARCRVPVIVEGGLGTAAHAAGAMELGASAVLVNTALARACKPVHMALAMRQAVEAGRRVYKARPMAIAS
jgi:thiazole synthase